MTADPTADDCRIDAVDVYAFEVPTDGPDGTEQDGTLEWDSTTMILVRVHAGGRSGLGYTYGDVSVASFVASKLAPLLREQAASAPPALWHRMGRQIRNAGRPGVGAMAVSAVDVALWDLKARLLDLPLVRLLPTYHDRVPVYCSGGFTNYSLDRLTEQLAGWVGQDIRRVKLKTSREPERDPERLTAVRKAVGDEPEIFTDANGALSRKEALYWARRFHDEWDVRWFEEPVSSADLEGLRTLRERGPERLEIAAGEYAFTTREFTNLTDGPAGPAVDCLQADVTRCGGITAVLEVAGLAAAPTYKAEFLYHHFKSVNHFHTDVGVACVEAIEAAGWQVIMPERHICCGRPLYDYGFLDTAERYLRRVLDILRPHLRAGTPVVGMEPSCLAVFKDELPKLLPHDDDAHRLTRNAYHFPEFFRAFGIEPSRLDGKALLWEHCHQRATGGMDAEQDLLEDMGLQVQNLKGGCCGLAGSWGFESGTYEISLDCGEQALLPAVRDLEDDCLIVADGFSCKTQIRDAGTGRQALHVAEVMKLACDEGSRSASRPPERGAAALPAPPLRERALRTSTAAVLAAALTAAGVRAARR